MSKKANAVAKANPSAVGAPYDYSQFEGEGMDVTMDDLKIPFLTLVQKDSKVAIPDEDKYVEGAEAGHILNSATKQLFDGGRGILIVPAVMKTSLVEYLPERGGYVAEHEMDSELGRQFPRGGKADNGNDLVKTKTLFAVIVDDDLNPIEMAVIGFSSSKLSAWSDYFTAANTAKATKNAPLFSRLIRIAVVDAKNKKGLRYKNYAMFPAVTDVGGLATKQSEGSIATSFVNPEGEAFKAALGLRQDILSGKASADTSGMDESVSESTHF